MGLKTFQRISFPFLFILCTYIKKFHYILHAMISWNHVERKSIKIILSYFLLCIEKYSFSISYISKYFSIDQCKRWNDILDIQITYTHIQSFKIVLSSSIKKDTLTPFRDAQNFVITVRKTFSRQARNSNIQSFLLSMKAGEIIKDSWWIEQKNKRNKTFWNVIIITDSFSRRNICVHFASR